MKFLLSLFVFIICLHSHAQNKTTVEHFDSIISTSSTFKNKKIIKIREINDFRSVLVSSEDSLTNSIEQLKARITSKDSEIKTLSSEKENLNIELEKSKSLIENIDVFGIPLSKKTYTIIMLAIILCLLIVIITFIMRSKSIKITNKELKESLENTNQEFDNYKQSSIEKQQKLGRELLDVKKKLNPNK